MTIKSTIPALVACFALGGAGAAFAEGATQNTAGTYGAGSATANEQGVTAGGMAAGKATTGATRSDERLKHHDRRKTRDREPAEAANSATTYGSGVVSTTRDSAKAGVTTGGAASGSGVQSTGSTVDAYGETTKDGSNADIYGDSTATSGEKAH